MPAPHSANKRAQHVAAAAAVLIWAAADNAQDNGAEVVEALGDLLILYCCVSVIKSYLGVFERGVAA